MLRIILSRKKNDWVVFLSNICMGFTGDSLRKKDHGLVKTSIEEHVLVETRGVLAKD